MWNKRRTTSAWSVALGEALHFRFERAALFLTLAASSRRCFCLSVADRNTATPVRMVLLHTASDNHHHHGLHLLFIYSAHSPDPTHPPTSQSLPPTETSDPPKGGSQMITGPPSSFLPSPTSSVFSSTRGDSRPRRLAIVMDQRPKAEVLPQNPGEGTATDRCATDRTCGLPCCGRRSVTAGETEGWKKWPGQPAVWMVKASPS